ncbi:hypothetical protein GCM10010218_07270 [Streptomyces mashuensis]|uniref:Uncharacterized protein n=1 Tax=Streptomyces mashuensis TaxID=33904 RepID=A0A919AVT9_9ACTN|nr:DUF6297 family protein [Streptomyces mashuensis]GHF28675.1 hypothetical protein GCM10010218_07270 [Streptomyces mashuensis]
MTVLTPPGTAAVPDGSHTAAALAHLHEVRGAFRARRRKSAAMALYVVALAGAGWGLPLLVHAARADRHRPRAGTAAAGLLTSLPPAAAVVCLLVPLLLARGAVWRGPVVVDLATVTWLLPTPVARAAVLLPRLASAATLAGLVGAATGAVAGLLLAATGAATWPAAAGAGAWAGAATALTGTAAGVLVERHDRLMARHGARLFGTAWAVTALFAAGAAAAALRGSRPPSWLGPFFLWSGPWGWAAQPLAAATGTGTPAWWAGALLSAGFTTATLLLARREAPHIGRAALRLRATAATRVGTALSALELRQARAGIPALRERGSRPVLRLPAPRRTWLLMPWRDATGLLRAPGRLGWAAVWAAAAPALTALAPHTGGTTQRCVVAGGLVAAYLAAAQLVEPARLDSDDPRRSAHLPRTPGALALWHAVVPGLLLAGLLAAGGAAALAAGRLHPPAAAALLATAPALVGAALVGAYRGSVPTSVLVGVQTAMGNTGPVQTVVWYVRGPLVALLLTGPAVARTLCGGTYGPWHLAWQLLLGAGCLEWARRTARRLHRG